MTPTMEGKPVPHVTFRTRVDDGTWAEATAFAATVRQRQERPREALREAETAAEEAREAAVAAEEPGRDAAMLEDSVVEIAHHGVLGGRRHGVVDARVTGEAQLGGRGGGAQVLVDVQRQVHRAVVADLEGGTP